MTVAVPVESVVTMRDESTPESVVKRIEAPCAEPPDWPGLRSTERVTGVPGGADCASPCFVRVAAGFPTSSQPPCVCVTPEESLAVIVK